MLALLARDVTSRLLGTTFTSMQANHGASTITMRKSGFRSWRLLTAVIHSVLLPRVDNLSKERVFSQLLRTPSASTLVTLDVIIAAEPPVHKVAEIQWSSTTMSLVVDTVNVMYKTR